MQNDKRQQKIFRVRVAYAVSVFVIIVALYAMAYFGISLLSASGLLILLGIGWFLWRFWRDTLQNIRSIDSAPAETLDSEE